MSHPTGKGASTQCLSRFDDTPLHLAASRGYANIMGQLLNKGASIEAVNEEGNTPMDLAAESEHTSVMELLLRKDAQIGTHDAQHYHMTVLAWLA